MRGRGGRGGRGEGVYRAEGAKICIIRVGFMVNRAEGAKIFGIQVGGRGGREGLIYLMGQDLAEKKSSIPLDRIRTLASPKKVQKKNTVSHVTCE